MSGLNFISYILFDQLCSILHDHLRSLAVDFNEHVLHTDS
jgi:hypothetical protein